MAAESNKPHGAAGKPTPPPTLAALATIGGSDEDDRIALYLRRIPFCIVWWLALLFHAGCAAFLCSTTAMYEFLGGFDMIYFNKLLGSTLRHKMGSLGYVFVGIAALHFLEILRMFWFSLQARRLTFNAIHHVNDKQRKKKARVVPASAGEEPAKPKKLGHWQVPKPVRKLGWLLQRVKTKLIDRKQGLLGLESPYFYPLFLLRESVEIASQSYQMYQCSMLIADPWINNLFLTITVVNCWSTPILQHALARFNALERVICLTLDGFLDAGACMVIPLILVFKYIEAFDADLFEFPNTKLQDPEWFTALILENRMLFAMNKTDLFTSLMPHYSLFGCFRKVKRLIYRMPPELENEQLKVAYVNSMRILIPKSKTQGTSHHDPDKEASLKIIRQPQGKMPGWKRRFIHVFFIGWGATIVAVHVRARQVALRYTDVVACKSQLRPWFASSFMCATFNFDCVEQGNVGTLTSENLSAMDASTLSSMIISNCPALEMPDAVQNFSALLKFMVYNSTIVSWPASASLNSESHSSLISISMVATTMSAFPEGLSEQLPDSCTDILFSKTNLDTLPDAIVRSWSVENIYFEYSEFTEFPTALLHLKMISVISFAGNKLTKLPTGLSSMASSLDVLVLGDNPDLVEFPTTGLPSGLTVLSIENTGVTTEPTAAENSGDFGAGGGPAATSSATAPSPGSVSASSSSPATASSSSGSSSSSSGGTTTSSGASGGRSMGRSVAIYAHNTPLCDSLGGVSAGDNGTSTTTSTVYCSTRDGSGVSRFPLDWTIERFRPRSTT